MLSIGAPRRKHSAEHFAYDVAFIICLPAEASM